MFPTPRPHELLCNATRIIGRDGRELNPVYGADITEAEIEGRRQVREYARFIKRHLAGCRASLVDDTGAQVGVRQTRQVKDTQTLTNDDVVAKAKSHTGIARCPWLIELTAERNPGSCGYSTTTTKFPMNASCRFEENRYPWQGAASPQSMKLWRQRG